MGEQSGGDDPINVTDEVKDIIPDASMFALFGGGALVIVLVVVFVAMYAKGKGGAWMGDDFILALAKVGNHPYIVVFLLVAGWMAWVEHGR